MFTSAAMGPGNSSQAALVRRLQWDSSRWQTHPVAFHHFQEPYICVYSLKGSAHSIHSKNSHVEVHKECILAFHKENKQLSSGGD